MEHSVAAAADDEVEFPAAAGDEFDCVPGAGGGVHGDVVASGSEGADYVGERGLYRSLSGVGIVCEK